MLISNDSFNQSEFSFYGSALFEGETKRNRSRTILQHEESNRTVDVAARHEIFGQKPEGVIFIHFGAQKGTVLKSVDTEARVTLLKLILL
jgi:hypothetical protein